MKTKPVVVHLDRDLHNALKKAAKEQNRTMGRQAAEFIKQGLNGK